ncbi:Signal recognition particle, subunit Srp72 [Phaffia rhodozyma]|uniref:Signal recognition particle subunit SRP72 n=1 Tax=Phaffia rhodozyma TaxID=264483 RepID=A0A0F7SFR1_PHARH|nr:Signal recognition particle, subunit Srp72 [Phaffia rhodozyma]
MPSITKTNKPTSSAVKKPFVQRGPHPADVKLPYLHKRLHTQIQDGHLFNAVKTCDNILALSPGSSLALLTKLSLLLHIDQYTSALTLLDSIAKDGTVAPSTGFERAYCLYRLGREKEASEVLGSLEGDQFEGDGKEFLEAQLAYRANDYATASDIYNSLLTRYSDDHPAHADILANQTLASSLADFLTTGYLNPLREAEDELDGDLDTLEESIPTLPPKSGQNVNVGDIEETFDSQQVKKKKRRHRLPKGVIESSNQPFEEDPERWIPLRSRVNQPSALTQMSNRRSAPSKGAVGKKKEGMGTGMTQGSYGPAPGTPSAASGGGGKKKKGRK